MKSSIPDKMQEHSDLRKYISTTCLKFGDFTLTSGAKSTFYLDIRKLPFDSLGNALVGKQLFDKIKDFIDPDRFYVGGVANGAIGLISSIIAAAYYDGKGWRIRGGFYILPESKQYGNSKQIEGFVPDLGVSNNVNVKEKTVPTILVDDVLTTGKSLISAIHIMEKLKLPTPNLIAVVVDRRKENKPILEIPVVSLFHISEFVKDYE